MDKQKRQVLQAIAKRAHEVTPPGSTILLFGSRARGDERPDSDWDILVLLDKEKITADDHENISYSLYDLGLDYQELVNTVLFTKKDWQDNRTAIFRINVLEDAIPL
ncbi:MAG: nucleotidyltransferase domain-containing protein [Bacteroidaceae bacterium]|nr:nucleotidyltransferase domain-containing protein [Bacteroidaceae bacterium]